MNEGRKRFLNVEHSGIKREKLTRILKTGDAKIYFIGIGGAGLSAIAALLLDKGYAVYGSDIRKSAVTEELSRRGAVISYCQSGELVRATEPDLAVYSLSIPKDSREISAAADMGVPMASRAELLGAVIDGYGKSVGVSGSHGKSTVTAMLSSVFSHAGKEPTVIGGAPMLCGLPYVRGREDYLIYEACEYRGSFLHFSPTVSVMLNLDLDHTDCYPTFDAICEAFGKAAALAREKLIISFDDEGLMRASSGALARVVGFSQGDTAEYTYRIIGERLGHYSFELLQGNKSVLTAELRVPGEHSVVNAVAAAVAALELGIDAEACALGLAEFSGIERRLQRLGEIKSATVIYDYAHHPKEIEATARALSDMGYKRVLAVFSPHTYSRTKSFLPEFAEALCKFSRVIITDVYAAREAYIEGASSDALAAITSSLGCRASAHTVDEAIEIIKNESFDCLLLMGAGDLEKIKNWIEEKQ